MTFDATQPTDNTKLRNLGIVIRPNWEAIETADSSFQPYAINFLDRKLASIVPTDPAGLSTSYVQYCKKDPENNPELFIVDQNDNITQMTKGVTINNTHGETFLPGGLILKYGTFTTSGSSLNTITYTALSPALTAFPNDTYNVVLTPNSNVTTITYAVTNLTNLSFDVISNSNKTYFFVAIGN